MNDIEQLVRAAGDRAVPPVDVDAIRTRARARRRVRRTWRAVAAVGAIALVVTAALVVTGTGDGAVNRVDTAHPLPTFTRTPGIPGADQVGSIATDGRVYVATGVASAPGSRPFVQVPYWAIWFSPDGRAWRMVLSGPPQSDDPAAQAVQAAGIGRVIATAHGFVATGSRGLSGVTGSVAAVWHSPDGISWSRADDAQFISQAPGRPPANLMSDITAVVERDGSLLGVGDIYTNSRAPGGGQPCLWTSADGLHWQHRVINLGKGFDPNVGSVAVHGRTVLVSGHVDRSKAVVWSSRDLVHWRRVVVDGDAGIGVFETPHGLFGVGARETMKGRIAVSSVPTIWRATNPRDWRVVFRAPATTDVAGFGGFATDGRTLVMATTRAKRLVLYGSGDGSHWRTIPTSADVFPRLTSITAMANLGGRIVLAGYVQDNSVPYGRRIPYFWTADR